MAVIIDPDNLDRNQVIFGTTNSRISLYPVGSIKNTASNTDGVTTVGTKTFTSALGDFVTKSITTGDILVLKNKGDAGHFVVASRDSATQLTLASSSFDGYQANFAGATGITYEVRAATGGSIADGVTMQCLYSYAKEQWRNDTTNVGGDDLIRYPFPIEAITSEQFEVGGGTSHADWELFNNYTRKKVRTGGFASKNTAGSVRNEWTGIVTLGSLDSDAQIYYQQTDTNTAPTNFAFLGPVNESITINDGSTSYKTYLKLFARKKARTYSQATIGDIGVSSIQTIVNRFPLAHSIDTAISASDAEILGSAPFRNQTLLVTRTDGAQADVDTITGTLTSAGATFQTSKVVAGDTLKITTGAFAGKYFTITDVTSETVLTVDTTEQGPFTTLTSQTFEVYTTIRSAAKSAGVASDRTDGAIANVTGTTGTITSAGSNFTTDGVVAGDILIITEAASEYRGLYRVISKDSNTVLTVDTTDKTFGSASNINFRVVQAGMYLQYKHDNVAITTPGNLTFAATGKTITRSAGSWITDGVTAGTVIVVTGTSSNNKSFTVLTRDSATQITCVSTDTLVNEGPVSATYTAYDAFKRSIGGVNYSFDWKVSGNNTLLSNIYQFIQHQLRQTSDIDWGASTHRGDVTDLLMSYAAPTGTSLDLYVDNLSSTDINSITYKDSTGVNRTNPFVAAGTISFNDNLVNDASAKYWLFYTTNPTGNYGTSTAVLVKDSLGADITGTISGQPSISFTFDYDGNTDGGRTAGTNAAVTLVAIGLNTAQFVLASSTITKTTSNSISVVSSLERNYSNA